MPCRDSSRHLLLIAALALVFAIALPARDAFFNPNALLPNLDEKIATLDSLVLHQHISRYAQVGNRICQVDSFDALVDTADGSERYTEVRRNGRNYSHVSQVDGIWSFGETVTMLRTTRDALHEGILKPGRLSSGGPEPESEIGYSYTAANRRWFLTVGSQTYWLDFEAFVRIAPGTGDITRIAWISSPLPPETGIARIMWTVDFHSVAIAGRLCTIPETAVYRIERTGSVHRADWNVTEFSQRGRYGSEAIVRFEP